MSFQLCENTGFFLRMGLVGPSGSGKTYTALKLATELGYERIGIIDTENRSARRYAKTFARRFMSMELERYSPKDYIEAMAAAESAGIEVLVIDSLSHAWMGKGGVLDMVDQSARRQSRGGASNSFSGWREVTPEHNRLVDALVHTKLHLIVTMRVKTEYVVEKDDRGKSVPRKVGLAPVQRDGLEYEFDIVGEMSPEHDLCVTKSRCPAIADAVMRRPDAELATTLRAWLDGTTPPAPAPDKRGWREQVAAALPEHLADLRQRVLDSKSLSPDQRAALIESIDKKEAGATIAARLLVAIAAADSLAVLDEIELSLEEPGAMTPWTTEQVRGLTTAISARRRRLTSNAGFAAQASGEDHHR